MTCGDAGSKQPLRSDEQGRLRGVWIENPFNQPLLGYSEDRRLVAFAFSNAHPTTHQAELRGELVLVPAVHVVGRLRTTVAPPRGVLAIDVLRAHPEHPAVQRGVLLQLEAPDFSLPLPAGTYRLRLRYGFGSAAWRTFIAPAERTEFDLGPVTVPSKPLDLIGEVLPDWTLDSTGGARTRPALAALASHPRRSDFAVVLYDTSLRDPQQKAAAVPNGPEVEKLFTVLTPSPHSDANELYGTRWAIAVLDADGRLAHCGREVPDAVAVLERLLR
jgi:hypothetical protein